MTDIPIDEFALANYLAKLHGSPVECLTLTPLGLLAEDKSGRRKGFGYGKPIRLNYRIGSATYQRVLHTSAPGPFGHEHMADRAAGWLWSHQAFNKLPGHVPSYDVAAFASNGAIHSLGDVREVFLLTGYAEGKPYGEDLGPLAAREQPQASDIERCDALCDYLVMIHSEKHTDPNLYRKSIRQLVGHHECIFGLIDSYPDNDPVATPHRLQVIEQSVMRWRWRLKPMTNRLGRVHGDFHPWNLIFDDDNHLTTLDRSRVEYGDPADDVTSITINYLFQSLLAKGEFTGASRALYDRFWNRYLTDSGDQELLAAAAPFFTFRALVLASTLWYPDTPDHIRNKLLTMVERLLERERFEPDHVDELLADQ